MAALLTIEYLDIAPGGFPHSDICGSTDICSSPELIAAYHVLLRLPVPRHPPRALLRLVSIRHACAMHGLSFEFENSQLKKLIDRFAYLNSW